MSKFLLTTDTSCDIFRSELDAKNIPWLPLTFTIDGENYVEDNFTNDSQYKGFYDSIRGGAFPKTSQINDFTHTEFFNSLIEKGNDRIIHISLSGGLSGTRNSALASAEKIMQAKPNVKIEIINTLAATQGNALIVDEAVRLRDSDVSFEDSVKELNETSTGLNHWIIIDDLMHLKHGGRVSGASAYIGSMLKIKPILVLNDEGKLAVVKKCKGSIKSYAYVMDMIEKYAADPNNNPFYLANADSTDKIEAMKVLIQSKYKGEVKIGWVGPVIGAHTGVNMIGVIFKGKKRLSDK